MMKKRWLAAALAAALALSLPMTAAAEWKQDENQNWQWTEADTPQTGWKWIDGKWYHFNENGIMSTGWVQDNGSWYYLETSGQMATGWKEIGGQWYALKSNGAMSTGWVQAKGKWYFLQNSGAMATGWVEAGGKKYFTDNNGVMQTGVVAVDGKIYSLDASGAMQTGEIEIDGEKVTFAESGEAIKNIPTPQKAFDKTNKPTEIPEAEKAAKPSGGGGGGTSGGGGSSGGSGGGSSGGSGGGSDSGSGGNTKPDKKLISVDGGTFEDTEEGICFTTDEGTRLGGKLRISAYLGGYFTVDSTRVHYLTVDDLFADIANLNGTLSYYPEGLKPNSSANSRYLALLSKSKDEESKILTFKFGGVDAMCSIRLKIADDKKSVTLVGITSDDLIKSSPGGVIIDLNTESNDTVTARSEQDVINALKDPAVSRIIANTNIEFQKPLTITRDIEISKASGAAVTWKAASSWQGGNSALISVQNGAELRIISEPNNGRFLFAHKDNTADVIEVNGAALQCEGITFSGINRHSLKLKNAIANLYNVRMTVDIGHTGIDIDPKEGDKTTLKVFGGAISGQATSKYVVSGSKDSDVTLPDGYVEFTNADGQREWTNDPDKIAPLLKDDENEPVNLPIGDEGQE